MSFNKIKLIKNYSIMKTIYYNFKYLNFRQAIKFPFIIGKKVKLIIKGNIYIEDINKKIIIDKGSKIIINGNLIIKGRVHLGEKNGIYVAKSGILTLGDNVKINSELSLNCLKEISIGDNSLLAWRCTVLDCDFHNIYDYDNKIINKDKPVTIGDKVWIGNNVIILKGTKIHNNCIIGAGSVVSKNTSQENSIYAGLPIKQIKKNIKWEY